MVTTRPDLYREIFLSYRAPLLLLTREDLLIIDANEAAGRVFQQEAAVLLGRRLLDLAPDLAQVLDKQQAGAAGAAIGHNGISALLQWSNSEVLLVELIGSEQSITSADAAVSLQALIDPIAMLDEEGVILRANTAFVRLTGVPEGDLIGKPVASLAHPEHSGTLTVSLRHSSLDGARTSGEIVLVHNSGAFIEAEYSLTRLNAGDLTLLMRLRDITQYRQASRIKDTFIANISHELRTPTTVIKLYLHLLEANPNRQQTYLDVLNRETERLHRLINDLLEVAGSASDYTPGYGEQVNVTTLLTNYLQARLQLARSMGLSLSYDIGSDIEIISRAARIEQVIAIVVKNAMDYTPAGGHIEVVARLFEDKPSGVQIVVQDSGKGLTAEDFSGLFMRFQRGSAGQATDVPGSGVGLWLARRILDSLGGQIQLSSPGPDQGTRVVIWLPRQIGSGPHADEPGMG